MNFEIKALTINIIDAFLLARYSSLDNLLNNGRIMAKITVFLILSINSIILHIFGLKQLKAGVIQ